MGQPARPLSERIRAAIESAGRPLTRSELSAFYLNDCGAATVRAELERMLAAGELVDAGREERGPADGYRYVSGPWRLYGLTPRRQNADPTPGQSRPGGKAR